MSKSLIDSIMHVIPIKEILLISSTFLYFFFPRIVLNPYIFSHLINNETKNSLKILIKSFYISRTLLWHHYNVLYTLRKHHMQTKNLNIIQQLMISQENLEFTHTQTHSTVCVCHLIFKLPFQGLPCLYSFTYHAWQVIYYTHNLQAVRWV